MSVLTNLSSYSISNSPISGWTAGPSFTSNFRYNGSDNVILEIFATSPVARPLALRSLAPLYVSVGRADDAVAAYASLVELIGTPDTRVDLANALLAAGRAEEALRALDEVGALSGERGHRLRLARAYALAELDRFAAPE